MGEITPWEDTPKAAEFRANLLKLRKLAQELYIPIEAVRLEAPYMNHPGELYPDRQLGVRLCDGFGLPIGGDAPDNNPLQAP